MESRYIYKYTLIEVLAVVPVNHHKGFLTKEEKEICFLLKILLFGQLVVSCHVLKSLHPSSFIHTPV